jgi:hypothetical protein
MYKTSIVLAIWLASLGCSSLTEPDKPELVFINATGDQEQLGWTLWEEQKACASFTKKISEVPIKVLPGVFVCGSIMAAGCTYSDFKIAVASLWYENALSHEYIHLYGLTRGDLDSKHTGPLWSKCDWRNYGKTFICGHVN